MAEASFYARDQVVDLDAEAAEVSFLWAREEKFESRALLDILDDRFQAQVAFMQADAQREETSGK